MLSFFTRHTPAVPKTLFVLYVLLFAALAINPVDRGIWFAENATVILILIPIVILYIKGFKFSNLSYVLMSVLLYLHTIGGHYTFALVPFDWFDQLIGSEKNNFNHVAHFTVGFYAFPIAEFLMRRSYISNKWTTALFGVFAVGTVAAVYEVIEWLSVLVFSAEDGMAFLGAQGDIWDAQKDMLADISGAVLASILFLLLAHRYGSR